MNVCVIRELFVIHQWSPKREELYKWEDSDKDRKEEARELQYIYIGEEKATTIHQPTEI